MQQPGRQGARGHQLAALPETLLESELFGHEKGAFTGARRRKRACFELADGGTLFLDEIGEMPPPLAGQAAARARGRLDAPRRRQQRTRVNVRLLAATNRDLAGRGPSRPLPRRSLLPHQRHDAFAAAPQGSAGNITLLVQNFLGPGWEIEPDALQALECYPWPGNVRQLMNVIDRAKIMADDHHVGIWDFPVEIAARKRAIRTPPWPRGR